MKSRNFLWRFAFATLASAILAACSVSPDGPAALGGSHGSLGSPNMSDYFYKKQAGWTYIFQNTENIYDSNGVITQSLLGANDIVQTMGFDQIGPNGDSLFRYQITYRVSAAYAGGAPFDLYYIPATRSNMTHGAFIAPGAIVGGAIPMQTRPRPVSTDTILAGIAGLIRTRADDFTNTGAYVWQTDTIWYSEHNDSAFIWEHQGGMPGAPIVEERCIFTRDFVNNGWKSKWDYDVINEPNSQTFCSVDNKDTLVVLPSMVSPHTVNIRMTTKELADKDFNYENKYFGCYIGPVYQYDWWYLTSDGVTFTKQDFTRQLVSLTQQN